MFTQQLTDQMYQFIDDLKRDRQRKQTAAAKGRAINCMELEDRILLSATPIAPEALVNNNATEIQQVAEQSTQSVASASNGDHVIVWSSQNQDGSGWDIHAQRFDANGAAKGDEFQVNSKSGNEKEARVAMSADGHFVITWTDANESGADKVYAKCYDANGNLVQDEFVVNSTLDAEQMNSSVAMNDSGFIVTWTAKTGENQWNLFGQRFDYSGNPSAAAFQINAASNDSPIYSRVGIDNWNYLTVAWESQTDGQSNIHAAFYDPTDSSWTGDFIVNSQDAQGDQRNPSIAFNPNEGSCMISWTSDNADGTSDIYARRYDCNGTAIDAAAFKVNTTAGHLDNSSIAVDINTGGSGWNTHPFVVTWSSYNQDELGGWGVYSRSYNADGVATTGEIRVNTTTEGSQNYSSIAYLNPNSYVVAWTGRGEGDYTGVYSSVVNTGFVGQYYNDINAGNPSFWNIGVGYPGQIGSSVFDGRAWTVNGGGAGIGGTFDNFTLTAHEINGNADIFAKLESLSSDTGKAGVMFRDNSDGDSAFAGVFQQGNTLRFEWRDATGHDTSVTTISGVDRPVWLDLHRSGNMISAYYSYDNITWVQIGDAQNVSLRLDCLSGLAVTGNNNDTTATGVFSHFSVVNPQNFVLASIEIGAPGLAGSTTFANGVYTITGGGSGLGSTNDKLQFGANGLIGDWSLSARIASQDGGATAGILFRNSSDANSAYAGVVRGTDDTLQLVWRASDGGESQSIVGPSVAGQVWVKTVRSGNSFEGWYSTDGANWIQIGSCTITANETMVAGIAATSNDDGALRTATIDNLAFSKSVVLDLSGNDIGGPAHTGGSFAGTDGTYVVSGSGNDLYGSSDQFHFTSTSLSGNGSIVARVNSMTNTSDWAMAGVMMRASDAVDSPYVIVSTTPTNGFCLQWRDADGNIDYRTAGYASGNAFTEPGWVKLTRNGDVFTASYSADGIHWTNFADTPLIAMGGTIQTGLAVAAANSGAICTAEFTNVEVAKLSDFQFTDTDIGNPGLPGSASYDGNTDTYTVIGSGNDMYAAQDQCNFNWTNHTGDGTLIARVDSMTNTDGWAIAGVMFRENNDPSSMYAILGTTPGNGLCFQWRNANGSVEYVTLGYAETGGTYTNPAWVKLTRTGNLFTAFYSVDGVNWSQVGPTATVAMSQTVEAGLAVAAANNSALCTATMTNVSISQTTDIAWTDADIGGATEAGPGSTTYPGAGYVVIGGGNDISGAWDRFRYDSQEVTGDTTMIAKVNSISDSNEWSKSGLMFRENLNGDASYAAVYATRDRGVVFEYRNGAYTFTQTTGGDINDAGVPVWLKMTRSGNIFSAYYSTDGTNWNFVGSSTLGMGSEIRAGVCVCSHNDQMTNTTVFSNISLTESHNGGETALGGTPLQFVASQIDYNWGANTSPAAGVSGTNWSASWSGKILAETTGTYNFAAGGDDGVRVWINDQLVVDYWQYAGFAYHYGSIDLEAGQWYSIRMEYFQGGADAAAQLWWSQPGQGWVRIDASHVSSDNTAPVNQTPGSQIAVTDTPLVLSSESGNAIQIVDSDSSLGPHVYPVISDASFESKNLPSGWWLQGGSSGGWNYDGPSYVGGVMPTASGLVGNNSDAYGNPSAVYGSGAAVIQGSATIWQDINFTTGGEYSLSVLAAARNAYQLGNRIEVRIDGVAVGVIDPGSNFSYNAYSTGYFSVTAGTHRLSFVGMASGAVDQSTFLDQVSIVSKEAQVQVSLSTDHGTLSLSQTEGLKFLNGTTSGGSTMTMMGFLSDINAALEGMRFTPTDGFTGMATVQITTNDLAPALFGGPKSTTSTISIEVASAQGFVATYYDNADFSGTATQKVAETINLDLQGASPAAGIEDGNWSARWLGWLEAPTSGNYTFHATTDSGCRVWINNQLVIDELGNAGEFASSPISLVAGQAYLVRMEYSQTGSGSGQAKLEWSGGGLAQQLISADRVNHLDQGPNVNVPGSQSYRLNTPLVFSSAGGNAITVGNSSIDLSSATISIADSSFEANALASGASYDPTTSAWLFEGFSGITHDINGFSGENGVTTPSGSQAAFIQLAGSISQDVFFAESGEYTISCEAAHRAWGGASDFTVLVDGVEIGTFRADSETYHCYQTESVLISAGTHKITFKHATAADQTVFIDQVSIYKSDSLTKVTLGVDPGQGTLSLSQLTGLIFIDGDGSDDETMTFIGSIADINAALEGMRLLPGANVAGAIDVHVAATSTITPFSGGPQTATDSFTANASAVSDYQGLLATFYSWDTSVGSSYRIDTALDLQWNPIGSPASGISGDHWNASWQGDVTAANYSGNYNFNLTAEDGVRLWIDGNLVIDQAGNSTLQTFTHSLDLAAGSTHSIRVEYYNSSAGGSLKLGWAYDNVTQDAIPAGNLSCEDLVSQQNESPVNNLPGQQLLNMNTPLIFSAANGNGISVSDPDIDNQPNTTVTVLDSSFETPNVGTTFHSNQSNPAGSVWTFVGSSGLAGNNSGLLCGNGYAPGGTQAAFMQMNSSFYQDINFAEAGNYTISFQSTCRTYGGTSPVSVFVDGVNVCTLTPNGTNFEGYQTNSFAVTAGSHRITFSHSTIADQIVFIDQVSIAKTESLVQVSLALNPLAGSLTLSQTGGLRFLGGDGVGDSAMTFSGTLADVNAALEGMKFMPGANYTGSMNLQMTTTHPGSVYAGGSDVDTDSIPIYVSVPSETQGLVGAFYNGPAGAAVDFSNLALNKTATTSSNWPYTEAAFATDGNLDTVTHTLDGDYEWIKIDLSPGADTALTQIKLFNRAGGCGDRLQDFTVSVIDHAGNVVWTYTDHSPTYDDQVLTLNTGNISGEYILIEKTDGNFLHLREVQAFNYAVPQPIVARVDTAIDFDWSGIGSPAPGISTSGWTASWQGKITADYSETYTFHLTASDGVRLWVNDQLMIDSWHSQATNEHDATIALVAGQACTFRLDYYNISEAPNVKLEWSSASQSREVVSMDNLSHVNSSPTVSVPGEQTTDENTAVVFSTATGNPIRISDFDAINGYLEVTLSVEHGTLSLNNAFNLMFSAGDGTSDSSMTFFGSLEDINAALNGLRYTPAIHGDTFISEVNLQIAVSDNALALAGGAGTSTAAVPIAITIPWEYNGLLGSYSKDWDHTPAQFSGTGANLGATALAGSCSVADGVYSVTGAGIDYGGYADEGYFVSETATGDVSLIARVDSIDSANDITKAGLMFRDSSAAGAMHAAIEVAPNGYVAFQWRNSTGGWFDCSAGYVGTEPMWLKLSREGNNFSAFYSTDGTTWTKIGTTQTIAMSKDIQAGLVVCSRNENALSTANFSNVGFAQDAAATRLDSTINFNWGNEVSPIQGIEGTNWTSRWLGTITADHSEAYTFYATADDGVRLWVNDQLVIDQWHVCGGTTYTGTIDMVAGQAYSFRLEYSQGIGGESIELEWSSTSQTRAVISADHFHVMDKTPFIVVPTMEYGIGSQPIVFSSTTDNPITIAELDNNGDTLTVTLTASKGSISLSGIAGLTFGAGDGSNDATMTFTGSLARVNAALEGLIYARAADDAGTASIEIVAQDNGNSDEARTTRNTIQIGAVQEQIAGLVATYHNGTLLLDPVVSRIDSAINFNWGNQGSPAVGVSGTNWSATWEGFLLAPVSGTYTFYATTDDGARLWVNGQVLVDAWNPQAAITRTGTIELIAGQQYTFRMDFNQYYGGDSARLEWSAVSGQGQSILAREVIQADRFAHALQAPVIYVPSAQSIGAGTTLTFSTANGNGMRISDVDLQNNLLEVTLSTDAGTFSLGNTSNLTFTTGDGQDDSTMIIRGTLANVNAALDGLSFTPSLSSYGAAGLRIVALDTGSGLSADNTVAVNVLAANNPPVNSVPGSQVLDEHQTLIFSQANGNGISIDDPDIDSATAYVTIQDNSFESPDLGSGAMAYQYGVLGTAWTFTGTSGIAANGSNFGSAAAPTGDQVAFIQFGGMISQNFTVAEDGLYTISLEAAARNYGSGANPVLIEIDGVVYGTCNPNSTNFQTYRSDTVSLTTGSHRITFRGLNPGGDTTTFIDRVAIDKNDSFVQVTLSADSGSLVLGSTVGLNISQSSSSSMILNGTVRDVNAALEGLQYAGTTGFSGTDTLRITTNDLGHTGAGGPKSATNTVAIQVNAVNDPPVITVPGGQGTYVNHSIVFSESNHNAITVTDQDIAGTSYASTTQVQVTLSVGHGSLMLGGLQGLTFAAGSANGDATLTFTGTLANINAALNGLTYVPASGFASDDALGISVNDLGNIGQGNVITTTATVAIEVASGPVVNSTTSGEQQTFAESPQAVAADANGNYVVVWSSRSAEGETCDVYFRRFNASGIAQGDQQLVNSTTTGDQMYATVAMNTEGEFVVTWSSNGQDGGGWGVFGQRYDAAGAKAGAEFQINTTTEGDQKFSSTAISENGDVVAIWSNFRQDGSAEGVYARVFHADGSQSGEILVNETAVDGQMNARVAADADGNFTVVWQGPSGNGDSDIFARSFNAAGSALGSQFRVNGTTAGDQTNANIGMNDNGDYVVTWSSNGQDGSGQGIYARKFNADGSVDRVYTVSGSGADIWSNSDQFHFASQDASGDATMIAHVDSISDTGDFAKGGVMFRDSLSADAAHAMIYVNPDNLVVFQWRTANGAGTTDTQWTGQSAGIVDSPVWVKLVRSGNNFSGYYSTDGVNWVQVGTTQSIIMNSNYKAGLAVTAWNTNALCTANFTQVSLNGSENLDLSDTDIGSVNFAGSSSWSSEFRVNSATAGDQDYSSVAVDRRGNFFVTWSSYGQAAADNWSVYGQRYFANGIAEGGEIRINGSTEGSQAYSSVASLSPKDYLVVWSGNAPGDSSGVFQAEQCPPGLLASYFNNTTLSGTAVQRIDSTINFSLGSAGTPIAGIGSNWSARWEGLIKANTSETYTFTVCDSTYARLWINDQLVIGPGATGTFNFLAGEWYSFRMDFTPLSYDKVAKLQWSSNTVGLQVVPSEQLTYMNPAPVNNLPATANVNEDETLVFSAANGNAISISDIDNASDSLEVTLSVDRGVLRQAGSDTDVTEITLRGTLASINAALDGLRLAPPANFNGIVNLRMSTNDLGSTGVGGARITTTNLAVNVIAVNDPTVTVLPAAQTVIEHQSLILSHATGNGISISDVDAGNNPIEVTISSDHGAISLSGTAGLTLLQGSAANSPSITLRGTIGSINAALDGLQFRPQEQFGGIAQLRIVTNDLGNTGTPGPRIVTNVLDIAVTPVNDPPAVLMAGVESAYTQYNHVFSAETLNAIRISDPDAFDNPLRVTISVDIGTITLSRLDGLTLLSGLGTHDSQVTLVGKLADINAALEGMYYKASNGFEGDAQLRISVSDLGSGIGVELTDDKVMNINVARANEPPVNTVPFQQLSVLEHDRVTFDSIYGTNIRISDPDARSSDLMLVTLSADHGAITLNGTHGLQFLVGNGESNSTVSFYGTIDNINHALEGMHFAPADNFDGTAHLSITTNDLGNTGAGGAQIASNTIAIQVTAVNDAPTVDTRNQASVLEHQTLVFSQQNGNAIRIGDGDEGDNPVRVALSIGKGTLALAGFEGLTFAEGNGPAGQSMTFTGTVTDVNRALNGLRYTTGSAVNDETINLNIRVNDLGNTGIGGAKETLRALPITVIAVNDPPVISEPANLGSDPTKIVLSSANGNAIHISDPEGISGNVLMTLQVSLGGGTFTVGSTEGLRILGGTSTNGTTLVVFGSLNNINHALDGLVFKNSSYSATLQITVSDLSNSTGQGGPQESVVWIGRQAIEDPNFKPGSGGAQFQQITGVFTSPLAGTSQEILQAAQLQAKLPTLDRDGVIAPSFAANALQNAGSRFGDSAGNDRGSDRRLDRHFAKNIQDTFDIRDAKAIDVAKFSVNTQNLAENVEVGSTQRRDENLLVGLGIVSAGYLAWAFNGGSLLAGAISATPMWKPFDPLAVLDFNDRAGLSDGLGLDSETAVGGEDNLQSLFG